jgi:hypothetical protein
MSVLLDSRGAVLPVSEAPAIQNQIKKEELIKKLRAFFPAECIHWRVIQKTRDGKRGQVAPYIKAAEYINFLNAVLGVGGWNRSYEQHTISNISVQTRDNKTQIRSKLVLICRLELYGIGINSGSGEAWADDMNAFTSADSQAFKRASESFGVGLYLRSMDKPWVELDQNHAPVKFPAVPAAFLPLSTTATPIDSHKEPQRVVDSQANKALPNPKPEVTQSAQTKPPVTTAPASNPSKSPQTQGQVTVPNSAIKQELLEKRAWYVKALGQKLYDSVSTYAKQNLDPALTPVERVNEILKELSAAYKTLSDARRLAGELSESTVNEAFEMYKLENFNSIDTREHLEDLFLALDTAMASGL